MTRKSQNYLLLTLVFISSVLTVFADEVKLRPENFTHLTIEDGLPQNNVDCIKEDKYGYLWLCTSDGLVRFDGYEFELITEGPDGKAISNTSIRDIISDGDGLWIGTEDGLNYFDLKQGNFKKIHLGNEAETRHDFIKSLVKVSFEELWIGTREGVYSLDIITGEVIRLFDENKIINARSMLYDGYNVYIGNYGTSLIKVDVKNKKIINETVIGDGTSNNILDIQLFEEKLYLSTYGNGLIILDINLKTLNHVYGCKRESSKCLSSNYVYFTKKYKDEVLVGTKNGISLLDLTTNKLLRNIRLTTFIKNKYISNSIKTAYFTGNKLWFGLRPGGLIKYDSGMDGIDHISVDINSSPKFNSDRSVYGVTKIDDQTYLATYSGLYYLNNAENKLDSLKVVNNNLQGSALRISYICSIDKKIIFSNLSDIYKFDTTNNKLEIIKLDREEDDSFLGAISCSRKRILITSKKGIVYKYELSNKRLTRMKADNSLGRVNAIYDNLHLYFSTTNGLKIYKENGDSLSRIDDLLDGYFVTSVAMSNNFMIIGTKGNGLIFKNRDTKKIFNLPEKSKAIGNTIYDVVAIDDNLWASTNNGLINLDLTTFKFVHYVKSHGLGDKEFNLGSFHYDKRKNIIYAGGLTSLSIVDLNKVNEYNWEVVNLISKVTIMNHKGELLSTYYNNPSSIEINQGDTLIIQLGKANDPIRFKSNFEYKIEKLSGTMYASLRSNQKIISLVDVARSDFKIYIGEDKSAALSVKVTPYIWNRWWSYILYILVSFLIFKRIILHFKSIDEVKTREVFSNRELILKRRQVASLSHELRTPLNSIIGISESASIKGTEWEHIQSSAQLLRSLIDNALDSSALEMSGTINISETTFNIKDLVENVIQILKIYLTSKHIKLEFTHSKDIPEWIVSDKVRIQQVLLNLVKNALKHSKTAAKVKIDLSIVNSMISIYVEDNGIGIPSAEQSHIFDIFYKIDDRTSGFGLGLYISKMISRALNGKLTLTSELGLGSTFTFTFPFKLGNKEVVKDVKKNNILKKISIVSLLILEDDPLNIIALKIQLKQIEINDYKIVDNYDAYIYEDKTNYDCIILDLNFGHETLNGIALAKLLRDSNFDGLIYILTAESEQSTRDEAMKYVDDYLTKPVSQKKLVDILSQ